MLRWQCWQSQSQPVSFSAGRCCVVLFCCWFIIKSVWGEHALKVLRTGWDTVSSEGWNSFLTVGGETTESSKHFTTWALHLMKYCHVRHLLLWTLNYPWSHLEVRFPACVSKDIFYGFLLPSQHGNWILFNFITQHMWPVLNLQTNKLRATFGY